MSISKIDLKSKTKKHRPFGVWLLTIYALLYIGVDYPLPDEILSLGYTDMFSESAMRVKYVYVFLQIFVVFASILAWSGSEVGRKFFSFFVLLYFLGDGIYQFDWFTWIPDLDNVRMSINYVTDFVFPLLCIWYFNKPSTKEFFRKEFSL